MERRAGEVKTENEEAVSPIIGVVLMVAITVIIATVVSAFALTLAQDNEEQPINAAVDIEVDNIEKEITVRVTSMGNAEYVVVRGPLNSSLENSSYEPYLNQTGQQMTLTNEHLRDHGSVAAVGVQGNFFDRGTFPNGSKNAVPVAAIIPVTSQTQVNQKDYDFR